MSSEKVQMRVTSAKFPHSPILHYACRSFVTENNGKNNETAVELYTVFVVSWWRNKLHTLNRMHMKYGAVRKFSRKCLLMRNDNDGLETGGKDAERFGGERWITVRGDQKTGASVIKGGRKTCEQTFGRSEGIQGFVSLYSSYLFAVVCLCVLLSCVRGILVTDARALEFQTCTILVYRCIMRRQSRHIGD